MKLTSIVAALMATNVAAFPHMDTMTAPLKASAYNKLMRRAISRNAPQGKGALPVTPPPFDAKSQYISNKGAHKFVPPGHSDARGECPGLNAMANHAYLPHNGVGTIQQFVDATQEVFGMGPDLALFLSTYGAVVDGSLTSWSIGGKPHTGIGGSHGNYETDSSPLKSDLRQYGSLGELVISQFKEVSAQSAVTGQRSYMAESQRVAVRYAA